MGLAVTVTAITELTLQTVALHVTSGMKEKMSDDLISRQAAIDELLQMVEKHKDDRFNGSALMSCSGTNLI